MQETQAKRDKIISKIKKLLEMTEANGASKDEAIQAALKAQRLMAVWDVSQIELYDTEEEICCVESKRCSGTWRFSLASTIANNFRCKVYQRESRKANSRKDFNIVFVGYALDANAAAVTFNFLYAYGKRASGALVRRMKAEGRKTHGVSNAYLYGFVDGVREELEKQTKALMLVRPKAVDEVYEVLASNMPKARQGKPKVVYSDWDAVQTAEQRGITDGHDAIRSKRIEGEKGYLLNA